MTVRAYPMGYLWRRYWNVFATLTPNGTPTDADCAIALAFCRNSVPDRKLPLIRNVLHNDEASETDRDIKTMQSLSDMRFAPGIPNYDIAKVVYSCIQEHCLIMAAQWEIVYALFKLFGSSWTNQTLISHRLFCLWPHSGNTHYRTYEVLDHSLHFLPPNNFTHPLLVAHDLHLPRVYMLAAKRWQSPVVGFQTITRAFDKKSVHKQGTSYSTWCLYEALCRIHHFFHRWV